MADALVIALFVVGSIVLVVFVRSHIQRAARSAKAGRALDELERSPIAAATAGSLVRLRGTVAERDGTLVTRYGGDDAIGVHLTMSHRSFGDSPRWAIEDRCQGFWLSDASGTARVDVDGPIQLLLGRADEVATIAGPDMPEWMDPIWRRNGLTLVLPPADGNEFEVDEVLLRAGDDVDVMGLVTAIVDGDGRPEVTIGPDPDHGVVVRPASDG